MKRMIYFENLSQMFDFGKFKGCDIGEVLMFSPNYLNWVIENVDGSICAFSGEVIKQIELIFPNFIISNELMDKIKERQNEYQEAINNKYVRRSRRNQVQWDRYYEEDTYERYNGSYAQDEMGYSDDDIETIFDGDPSAYWNID